MADYNLHYLYTGSLNCCVFLSTTFCLQFKMEKKRTLRPIFCTKKMNGNQGDIETDNGAERAEEKQVESTTQGEPQDLEDNGFQSQGTEQERDG